MTQFELPNDVVNISKWKLVVDLEIPPIAKYSSGWAAPVTYTIFQWLSANALSLIDRITLTSRAGTIFADIPSCHVISPQWYAPKHQIMILEIIIINPMASRRVADGWVDSRRLLRRPTDG
jgi:hypothetical protein